ncbi:MAG TPA: biopolymer transporter ExbD [Polyangiaceae bacterium]|nr:biopolymer transporter ExbD [Polyangiaceae bacterium]
MGGVDVGGGGGGRRKTLDSEINMIPMIDLLMVTISFLLITAVWTHMARIRADAQVPGPPREDVERYEIEPEKQLHIEMRSDEKIVLLWKQGSATVDSIDVPRKDVVTEQGAVQVVRFPVLADEIASEWKAKGQHSNPTDRRLDQAILHTDDTTEFKYIVGLIDAIYQTHRDMQIGPKTEKVPAFNITFAVN